jgi:hypothetical protein
MREEVEPGDMKRIALHLGPASYGEQDSPWLFNTEIALYHDNRKEPLIAGTATIVEPSTKEEISALFPRPVSAEHANCLTAKAHAVNEFMKLSGTRSSALTSLAAEARRFLGEDSEPAERTCAEGSARSPKKVVAFSEMCVTYYRWVLDLSIKASGANLLKPGRAILSVDIQSPNGEVYELVTALDDTKEVQTCLGPASREDLWTGDCTDSTVDWKSNRINARIWTKDFVKYKEIAVSASFYKPDSAEVIDAIPDGPYALSVIRGW